jgi:hypothetical protein
MNSRKKPRGPTRDDALAPAIAAASVAGEMIVRQLKPLIGVVEAATLSAVNQQLDKGCEAASKEIGE